MEMNLSFRLLRTFVLVVTLLVTTATSSAAGRLRVVASTSVLGYFAHQIGGDRVKVTAIANGKRDLHYVEALPSYMVKLRNADIYLIVGLELDLWWQPLVLGARNPKLKVVDCSRNIIPMEVPTFKADARYGDLHRFGNPHYWLDPDNVPIICKTIADALVAADPDHASDYQDNLSAYLERFAEHVAAWKAQRPAMSQLHFVAYHNTWPYFARFFGCRAVAFVEEFPGVAPSPSHVANLISRIKAEHIPLVVFEPYHDKRIPELLAARTGCRIVRLPQATGGMPGTDTYEQLIDSLIAGFLGSGKE